LIDMQRGADAAPTGDHARVMLIWPRGAGVEADPSAYLLAADGRLRGDAATVFCNQPWRALHRDPRGRISSRAQRP
jgi:hypothetical protein